MRLSISHKTYSSWSLRPWLLMKQLGIAFDEHMVLFGDEPAWQAYRQQVPSGKVPALHTPEGLVWDSMGITEYLAERFDGVWPDAPAARAWARCAAAEMHSGFGTLRTQCSMNTLRTFRMKGIDAALQKDLNRLQALWAEGLQRFGGPFLAGERFTAVDAFFAPVAFRLKAYQLPVQPELMAYAERLLALPAMQEWVQAARSEPTDPPHEEACTAWAEPVSP